MQLNIDIPIEDIPSETAQAIYIQILQNFRLTFLLSFLKFRDYCLILSTFGDILF